MGRLFWPLKASTWGGGREGCSEDMEFLVDLEVGRVIG